jgi:hypothetical protein
LQRLGERLRRDDLVWTAAGIAMADYRDARRVRPGSSGALTTGLRPDR